MRSLTFASGSCVKRLVMERYYQVTAPDSERRLSELIESAPDAIFEFDSEGRIILANRRAEQLFGYSRDELIGETVETLVPEHLRSAHETHRSKYAQHPVTRPMGARLQLQARRKDGSHFPVEISLSPGERHRVTAIVRDITEWRQPENELWSARENYIHEIEFRNREAEPANQLKSELLKGAKSPDTRLTPREIQVLRVLCEPCSTKEAAWRLGISFKTVVSHRTHIMSKAGVHDPISLFRWGVREGYIAPALPGDGTKSDAEFRYTCLTCNPQKKVMEGPVLIMMQCPKHGLCWHQRSTGQKNAGFSK